MKPSSPTRPLEISFRGSADGVALRTFMPRFPSPMAFDEVAPGRWVLELDTPLDVRIEYRLEVTRGGDTTAILDPTNPRTATNPFGTNSVYVGPQWDRIDWMQRPVETGQLRDIRVTSHALTERRSHWVYSPPQLGADVEAPLLLVHDGSDYMFHAGLLRCVDFLIGQGAIDPVRLVGLNPRRRHVHYIGSEEHARHVVDEVLPHVRTQVPHDGRTFLMGASLGAVAAWHCAWSHPDVFHGLFLQSGTFALGTHRELTDRMYLTISRFVRVALEDDRLGPIPVMQTCGRYESLVDWNRTVAAAMAAGPADHRYLETWSGHDWGAWSGTLVDGLTHLFGSAR